MATVLVIDDDFEVLGLLRDVIAKAGHRVLTARSASEAWALLPERPAAIFVDIDMGEESGVAFVARLREHPTCARTPVAFVTAHADRAKPLIASGTGIVDVIQKPFRIELLMVRLNQMLKMPGAVAQA
jgi:DNA-binding response OmpR family regulator